MREILQGLGRGVVAGGLAAALALGAVLVRSAVGAAGLDASSGLAFPVPEAPRRDLRGGFEESRGDHRHEAVDIGAPRGARVIAASAGRVARLGSGGTAGLSVELIAADGLHCYFYAHLDAVSPALAEGSEVERGQTLGVVGTTGNAPADAPHLHFAVRRLAPGDGCGDGVPVDPAPLLRADSEPLR